MVTSIGTELLHCLFLHGSSPLESTMIIIYNVFKILINSTIDSPFIQITISSTKIDFFLLSRDTLQLYNS